jgi:hypothetical protein
MIGYHYTTSSCWLKIKNEGLIPHPLVKEDLLYLYGRYPLGIWIWPERLYGVEHAGSLIYQMATKGEKRVVLLELIYNKADLLKPPDYREGDTLEVWHDGSIGTLIYHAEVPGAILDRLIPPRRIRLIKEYDLAEIFSNDHRANAI